MCIQEILSQSLPQEEVQEDDRDILARALNVSEYPGRVRGKGFGVTPRDCFPSQKRKKDDELAQMREMMKVLSAQVFEMQKKLQDQERQLQDQRDKGENTAPERQALDNIPCIPSAKDSCTLASNTIPEVNIVLYYVSFFLYCFIRFDIFFFID